MIRSQWLMMPFAVQMLCMVVDELYFHARRTLPRWERFGHPLDTCTVLLCWSVVFYAAPTPRSVAVYGALSLFSCLFVTKDEWIHTQYCGAGEHWLHALLFILHPLTFLSAGLLWPALHTSDVSALSPGWIHYDGSARPFFMANAGLTLLFGLYQLLYWNLPWPSDAKAPSITTSIMR
jgi:hypothetical protein